MNFDFCLLRKSGSRSLLLLFAALLIGLACEFGPVLAGSKQGTNIVMTKDTLVLNDHHKKHSNNIVIKDGKHGHHHQHHHCNCHEHHVFVPMHHWGHHDEHWGHHWDHHHHKRADHGAGHEWWGDMQLAASNQMESVPDHLDSDQFDGHSYDNKQFDGPEQAPFLQGSGNEALNSLIKQRYMNPVAQPPPQSYNQFNSEGLHKISYPVFVKDDQN